MPRRLPNRRLQARRNKTLPAVRADLGLAADYTRRIERLIEEMARSVEHWVGSAYRANEPAVAGLAMDATPAIELQRTVKKMRDRWLDRFGEAAPDLAKYFARKAARRTDERVKQILLKSGYAIEFEMSPAQRDILAATTQANVALIKSIPEKYLGQVEGIVMRSTQVGGDLATLTRELRKQFGVTKKRAAFIAHDQNRKATSALTRARQLELGLTEAIWVHSHAGKKPRPTHLANDGKKFDIAKGWFDPDPKVRRRIQPGELIRCRCFSRAVIPGFEVT